ncbi:MAG: hypothetical protein ACRCSP_02600, partial [Rhodoglobus sp.]
IIQTPSGPMLESASPELLASLLADYSDRITAAGVPIDEWLAPGVSEETIRAELATVGLVAPDELLVWFGWHNGLSTTVPRTTSVHAMPYFVPLSVEDAVENYKQDVLEFEAPSPVYPGREPLPDEFYQWGLTEGFMRLIRELRGCAIECVSASSEPPRLRSINEDFYEEAPQGLFQAVSLCTLVSWWIESLDSGTFRWDKDKNNWELDLRWSSFPESQRAVRFS